MRQNIRKNIYMVKRIFILRLYVPPGPCYGRLHQRYIDARRINKAGIGNDGEKVLAVHLYRFDIE